MQICHIKACINFLHVRQSVNKIKMINNGLSFLFIYFTLLRLFFFFFNYVDSLSFDDSNQVFYSLRPGFLLFLCQKYITIVKTLTLHPVHCIDDIITDS